MNLLSPAIPGGYKTMNAVYLVKRKSIVIANKILSTCILLFFCCIVLCWLLVYEF